MYCIVPCGEIYAIFLFLRILDSIRYPPSNHKSANNLSEINLYIQVSVTGSAGRVGRVLCSHLLHKGYKVIGVLRPGGRQLALNHPRFETTEANVLEFGALRNAFQGVDAVVHCAGQLYSDVLEDARRIERINEFGTRLVAQAASAARVQHLVVLSSMSASRYNRLDCNLDPYTRSKTAAETIAASEFNGPIAILRLGWVIEQLDDELRKKLWPIKGTQVIVGDVPVPVVWKWDVPLIVAAALEHKLNGEFGVAGGIPTQLELLKFARTLAPRPFKIIDAKKVERIKKLRGLRNGKTLPWTPPFLRNDCRLEVFDWSTLGISLVDWRNCILKAYLGQIKNGD